MYCAKCKKWNDDQMLFCGYCGAPLSTDDELPAEESEGEAEARRTYGAPRQEAVEDDLFSTPMQGRVPVLNRAVPVNLQSSRAAKTVIPRRETDVASEDLFLDEEDAYDEDDDADIARRAMRAERQREKAYEEAERGGFVARHIRGIVSLSLLVMVALIVSMWAFSRAGQRTLAQLDLSRSPAAYARLAEDYAKGGSRELEGYYYGRALSLDPDNADYAVLMANAYIASGNTEKAGEALQTPIALRPDNADAYALLAGLYPATAWTAEVQALIDEGYRRTGDTRLK